MTAYADEPAARALIVRTARSLFTRGLTHGSTGTSPAAWPTAACCSLPPVPASARFRRPNSPAPTRTVRT